MMPNLPTPHGKLRKRVRRQQQPDEIRVEYLSALMPIVEDAGREFRKVAPEIIRLLEEERAHTRKDGARTDAGERGSRARELVDRAAREAADSIDVSALRDVALHYGKQTSDFQRKQLSNQMQDAIGIPYAAIERPTRDRVEEFAARNVDLIKTVPDRYFDRIRLDVEKAFATGERPETLAERFVDVYGIAERDAERIARDQIGKLNGEVNRDRQESIGVERFYWRTMNDNVVRDEHEEREGLLFEWGEADDGDPGEPINCRCYAEPDFSALLGEEDEAAGE